MVSNDLYIVSYRFIYSHSNMDTGISCIHKDIIYMNICERVQIMTVYQDKARGVNPKENCKLHALQREKIFGV